MKWVNQLSMNEYKQLYDLLIRVSYFKRVDENLARYIHRDSVSIRGLVWKDDYAIQPMCFRLRDFSLDQFWEDNNVKHIQIYHKYMIEKFGLDYLRELNEESRI